MLKVPSNRHSSHVYHLLRRALRSYPRNRTSPLENLPNFFAKALTLIEKRAISLILRPFLPLFSPTPPSVGRYHNFAMADEVYEGAIGIDLGANMRLTASP